MNILQVFDYLVEEYAKYMLYVLKIILLSHDLIMFNCIIITLIESLNLSHHLVTLESIFKLIIKISFFPSNFEHT